MAENIKGITIQFKGDSAKFDKSASGVKNALKLLKSEAKQFNTALRFDSKDIDALKGKLKNLSQQEKLLVTQTKDLKRQIENLEPGEIGGAKWTELQNKLNNAENNLVKVRNEMQKTSETVSKLESKLYQMSVKMGDAGEKLKNAGGKISNIGAAATKGSAAILGVGAAATKTSMEFESSMSEVKAISGATGEEFNALKTKAKQLGADTAFSSQEAASAMVEMGKAGWDTKAMLDGMDGVMDAAAASGTDLATTSTIVADAVSTFGLEAKESSRVADVLAQAANAGTIGMEELAESFKYVGPVATGLGVSLEDTSGALVALSQAGIKGSQAGTTLKNVMLRLSAPTDEVQGAINKTGLVVNDASGNFVGLNSILTQLRESTKGMTDTQRMAIASQIAGKEAASGLSALLSMNDADYKKLTDSMANCNGQAKQTAQTMRDNLSGDIDAAKGSIENLGISIGEALTPYLRKAAQAVQEIANKMNEWVEGFQKLSPAQQEFILKMGMLVTAIGPVMMLVGKVVSGFGSLMSLMSTICSTVIPALSTAFGMLSAPVLAVVAVIGSIVAVFAAAYAKVESFRIAMNQVALLIGKSVMLPFQLLGAFLSGVFNPIVEACKNVWDQSLRPAFERLGNVLNSTLIPLFKKLFAWINANVIPIFKSLGNIVGDILAPIFTVLGNVLASLINFVADTVEWFGKMWNKFKESTIGQKVISIFKSIANGIKNALNAVRSFTKGFSSMVQSVSNWVGNLVKNVSAGFSKVGKWIDKINPLSAGGFGADFNMMTAYEVSAGGYGVAASGWSPNFYTTVNVNGRTDQREIEATMDSLLDEFDKRLYERSRRRRYG